MVQCDEAVFRRGPEESPACPRAADAADAISQSHTVGTADGAPGATPAGATGQLKGCADGRPSIARRTFIGGAGAAISALLGACTSSRNDEGREAPGPLDEADREWESVRSEFEVSDEFIHMSALLISSHPRRVQEAIDGHRRELNRNPVQYVTQHNQKLQAASRAAAASYLDADASDIALTESTTMGLGLLYGGLRLEPGQEVLTTSNDYFVTHEALRLAAERSGATVREIHLYEHGENVSEGELVQRITSEVRPHTRAVALTWVHSSTGLKLPLKPIAEVLQRTNAGRDEDDRVLLCVDGVHGFGVEDVSIEELGPDFFSAGCHKWLFGPRGTGILWGRTRAWPAVRPTIPSFTDDVVWQAWLEDREPKTPPTAARIAPGGFKAFEHQWALPNAFELHQRVGKKRVARRTHELARHLKEGLAGMRHVRLFTPMDERLSAGIVCFDVDGMRPQDVVRKLRDRRIVATVTPYARMHARLAPSIRNTGAEMDRVLEAVRDLA